MQIALAQVPDEPERRRLAAGGVGELGIDDAQAQASSRVEPWRQRELHRALPCGGILAITEHLHAERGGAGAGEVQLTSDGVELRLLEVQISAAALPIDLVRSGGRRGELRGERLPDGV